MLELTNQQIECVNGAGYLADTLTDFGGFVGNILDQIFKKSLNIDLGLANHFRTVGNQVGTLLENVFTNLGPVLRPETTA